MLKFFRYSCTVFDALWRKTCERSHSKLYCESEFAGKQVTANVVRSDGKIVRAGMWPDFAEVDAQLLNEYCAENWSYNQYFDERASRFASLMNL